MKKMKRILISMLVLIGAVFIMAAPVNAANKTQLQTEIEATINTALEEYLATIDVKAAVDQVIDETLSSFIDEMTKETFEDAVKQEASNALMQHIDKLQTTLENAITSSTYEYTNNQVKEYLKKDITDNVNGKITNYNNKMTSLHRTWVPADYDDDGDLIESGHYICSVSGTRTCPHSGYTISDQERNTIITSMSEELDSILNFGYEISNNVLNNTVAVTFSQIATNYIAEEIVKYTDAQKILDQVRNDVKITVNDELKDIMAESIRQYIGSNSGQAIFTGIKDAIYYYIQQNGGLDKILQDGFGEETAEYVSGQIGNIVNESIKYSLAPYIKELSQGKIKEVTEKITQDYVNGGAWNVIVNSVSYNLDEILKTDNNDQYMITGDQIRENLSSLVDAYLTKNNRIIDLVNESLRSTSVEYHVTDYWLRESYYDGDELKYRTYKNPKYDNMSTIGQVVLQETRSTSNSYMENTIFPQVKSFAKTTVNNYMNGEGGTIIKQQLVDNVNRIFTTEVVEPLLEAINSAVAAWISNGIGDKITADLQVTIKEYLSNFNDAEDFSQATGIKLGEILKEVRYNTSSSSGRMISLEDLIASKTLVGAQRGRIIVPEESSVNPMDDATLEIGAYMPYKVKIYELGLSNAIVVNPYWTALTAISRHFPNPYGATILGHGLAGLSRTLAKYDTIGIKNLEPEEAYVLAHQKNTAYYPDRVQSAYYQVLEEVRGIVPEYDEGIVDKDTYQTIANLIGFASALFNVDWQNVWASLSSATTLREMWNAIPKEVIASGLTACGVTLSDLLPFIDPDILAALQMVGLNLSTLVNIAGVAVSSVVDWVATGGESFFTDMELVKDAAFGYVDKFTNTVTGFFSTINATTDKLIALVTPLNDQTALYEIELDSKMEEVASMSRQMEELDAKIANAEGDALTQLEEQRTELSTRLTTATNELNELSANSMKLAGLYSEASQNIEKDLTAQIGAISGNADSNLLEGANEDLSSQLDFFEGTESLEENATKLDEIVNDLGVPPTNDIISPEYYENIDLEKLRQEGATEVSAALTAIGTANTAKDLLITMSTNAQEAIEYFDAEQLITNPKYASLVNNSEQLTRFVEISNKVGVSLSGKNITTVFSEILTEWEKDPNFDPEKDVQFMKDVAKELGVEMKSESASSILDKIGMSWQEFKEKLKAEGGTDKITSSVWAGTNVANAIGDEYVDRLLAALKSLIPFPSEMDDGIEAQDPTAALELSEEAINLGIALDNWNEFEAKNGANLVDRTDYSQVKVSYSKLSDYILAGPFTIDYIREFYYPISEYDSEMVDLETGIISYTGIVEAELYADDAKTIKVEGWEFVYPEERAMVPTEDWAYEFPYPGEVFYLKFPSTENYSINTLAKMTFKLAKMDADGQTYQLSGGYDQLLWMTTGIPIPCPFAGVCMHGNPGGFGWCTTYTPPPGVTPIPCGLGIPYQGSLFCPIHSQPGRAYKAATQDLYSDLNIAGSIAAGAIAVGGDPETAVAVHKATALATLLAQNGLGTTTDITTFPKEVGWLHMIGNFYFCHYIPLGINLHAQNLEEIIYSKIYVEYQTVEIEMGEVQEYHNNNVNTTDILYPVERQGNLSEETTDVPQLPFLPNYDGYPGWDGYPYYDGNPNYPANPYYPDNTEYNDYPSWPYYTGDPTYPYYPNNPVIPLTFHIEGTVWLDNPGGTEAEINGIYDGNERGIPNVEVILYKVDDPDNYIAKTLTDENGEYMFEYIRVGFDYYVEFLYDGMTYKTTKYLDSDITEYTNESIEGVNQTYRENPEAFLDYSHAIEDTIERDDFNYKFYEISQNLATGDDGSTIPMEYKTWYTDNGAVSTLITTDTRGITLDEYKMSARTLTTDLYFPLDDQYQVDYEDLDLFYDGTDYYIHTYPGLEHINLGLVQREQGDINVKTDLYQIITTIKEDVQRYPYDDKTVEDDTYDILYREDGYYTDVPYEQELNPDDHAYRIDTTYGDYADIVEGILTEEDELNVYLEFKILIKNNATLHSGRVIVLENSFDSDLGYATTYDYTDMTSWIETPMNGTDEVERTPIIWHYRADTENGYSTIYTTDLKEKEIAPGEVVELHLVLKVNKDADGGVILDIKESISEVHTYAYNEGLIDKSSNPGSIDLGNTRTYHDGSDPAPIINIVLDRNYTTGNEITGYVWEDLIEGMKSDNNQFISDGLRESNEPLVDNVKVELIEVVTDKQTGKEVEVLRKTASNTDFYRTGEDIVVSGQTLDIEKGQYRFTKLETGIYKVKFTYGDDYQLSRDLTYNAQDYKTLALDTIIQQYDNKNLEVMILNDTSEGMDKNNTAEGENGLMKRERMRLAIQEMIDKLYERVQTVKVGATSFSEPTGSSGLGVGLTQKPNKNLVRQVFEQDVTNVGGTLADAIAQARNTFSQNADAKVIVILTDGYMENIAADRQALIDAQNAGVHIVTVACSTDEWDKATFGTESEPTAGNLYNIKELNISQYVTEVVLEDILLEFEKVLPNLTDAKDVEDVYVMPDGSKVGDVYSRKRNIDYSSRMTNENAEILDLDNIKAIIVENGYNSEAQERIQELADNTKVTAVTTERNILLSHNNERTQEVNLGLVERPKLEVKLQEKVSRIVVTLSNGDVLIDTDKNLTQNVQIIPNEIYSIYMDEEIMQGARIDIDYIITITNNGQVDTLADYFTYDMFNPTEVAYMTRTVPIRIGTLNNYYSNMTFRAEDNDNLEVETNDATLGTLRINGTVVQGYSSLIQDGKTATPNVSNIETTRAEDGRAIVLQETVTWDDKQMVDLKDDVDKAIDKDKVKVVETTSLKYTELFPNMSREVLSKTSESSINVYVKYSKNISANDADDTLTYKNSTEIVERFSDVGRRDYVALPGNYIPHDTNITEYDADVAEKVMIMPPFGENQAHYYVIAVVSTIILGAGIVFIRRKIL